MASWKTWFDAIGAWRKPATPSSEPRPPMFPLDRTTPRVPAEYLSLYTYLERRYATSVVLTFVDMEGLLGFALPTPAHTDAAWWAAAAAPKEGYSAAWVAAGRTATPNIPAKTVTFDRV